MLWLISIYTHTWFFFAPTILELREQRGFYITQFMPSLGFHALLTGSWYIHSLALFGKSHAPIFRIHLFVLETGATQSHAALDAISDQLEGFWYLRPKGHKYGECKGLMMCRIPWSFWWCKTLWSKETLSLILVVVGRFRSEYINMEIWLQQTSETVFKSDSYDNRHKLRFCQPGPRVN